MPITQMHHAISPFGDGGIVADHEHRHTVPVTQREEQIQCALPRGRVQRTGRLIR
ncbi:MAG: hypothetical protein ACRDPA_15135 [Solirubrobacteraceae bacterium]